MIEELAVSLLRQDGGTQPRAFINSNTRDEYAESLANGIRLPPALVFYDGENYWLADGFHRVEAAKQNGLGTFPCEVRQGTREDAQWESFGANKTHGLPRTNSDKQRAVEAALKHPMAVTKSNVQIAEHCGVAESYIRKVKGGGIFAQSEDGKKTVTRNGKTYTQRTEKIGKSKKQKTAPETDSQPAPPPPSPESSPVKESRVALESAHSLCLFLAHNGAEVRASNKLFAWIVEEARRLSEVSPA